MSGRDKREPSGKPEKNNHRLVLISRVDQDHEYFAQLARKAGFGAFDGLKTMDPVRNTLESFSEGVVVWDVDFPEFKTVRNEILRSVPPSRVVLWSDRPAGRYADRMAMISKNRPPFLHNFIRRPIETSLDVYARSFRKLIGDQLPTLEDFAPQPDCRVEKIVLKRSEERAAAVEAIQNIFGKRGLEKRLSAKCAQAVDEFLMNAIFDAAIKKDGTQVRRNLSRDSKFDLHNQDSVEMGLFFSKPMIGISVTDRYGSLTAEKTIKYIHQDFTSQAYQVRSQTGQGAGLGLYSIVHSGMSCVFSCQPGKKTEAMLFIPNTRSFQIFRKSFQWVSFFLTS